jgi:fibronectin-binding autotransporter adhesin
MFDRNHGLRPCAVAFAVALALGLSGCGGGANVRSSPPPPATGAGGFAGGDIDVGSGETTVWSNDITGSIDLIKGGAGTLVLTGTDSYNGGTTISAGTLQIGNGDTTGSITGDVKDNAFLVFDRSNSVTFNGIVSGSGSLTQAGAGTLILTGNNTYTSGTTISSGTLQIGNGGTTGSIMGDVTDNGSLVFDRSDDITFSDVVSGTGSLEQAGTGKLTLTGDNTYAGGTTISAGTLQIGNGGTTGSIIGDVTDNGSLIFDRSDDIIFSDVVSGKGSLEQAGTGKLTLTGNNTYTGGTTISAGTLQIGERGTTGWIIGNVTDNGSLIFNRSDDVIFNGIVSGTGSLEQAGAGTLTLTGANTYGGGTAVKGGTLEIAHGNAIGTGSVTVGDDNGSYSSKYILQVDNGVSLSNHIVLAGYGTLDNAGTLGGNVDIAVEGENSYFAHFSMVLNHDGGSMEGNDAGVMLYGYSGTVKNSSGGIIQGGNVAVGLSFGGQVSNDGVGSAIRSSGGVGVQSLFSEITVENTGGGTITGGTAAVDFHFGGSVTNAGVGSAISSLGGNAIYAIGESASVNNTEGATITGGSTAIYLQHGGIVTNDIGSTIKTTGTTGGDCGAGGDCAIYVASDTQTSESLDGELTLINAGTIVGNVQMIPTAGNSVTLSAGSSIQGDLDIGSHSGLTLNGDAGTVELYSHAVTGTTTFAGGLAKYGDGTWIIDNDDLAINGIGISGGILQIGNGGTQGSMDQGDATIYHGKLVFDRSDDVIFNGNILGRNDATNDGTLVQAGTGTLTLLPSNIISPTHIAIESGTLQIGNDGDMQGSCACLATLDADVVDNGSLVINSDWTIFGGSISGTGSVTKNGLGLVVLEWENTYSGGTTINKGTLQAQEILPGDAVINEAGTLDGYAFGAPSPGLPGVAGNLSNGGKVMVHGGDSAVGGSYTQSSTGTLAVSLGSKLSIANTATLNGGTLEVTGADSGYVSNTHTTVLTAANGLTGTFDQLVKDTGVVFTATTINYDANSVWLDTTGLNVTTVAAGNGVHYTPVSMGSARRVQGAFDQLDSKIAADNLSGVSSDFVHAAGLFQQAPTLQAAQASLQSLSGQLHATSAAMTFEAIDASSRALSDHFDGLLDKGVGYGMWTHNLSVGGDMARTGFNSVGFQLNGWLVGNDRQIGRSGVAGYAFGQSRGQQRLGQSYDHDTSRTTEGMFYAGWFNGNWYTQGRVGFGHIQQDVNRQILLGQSAQGVGTQYNGNYSVAYDEAGLHFGNGNSHITPFVDVQYARINRDGFAEQGAGGFGLQSNAQTTDRWQAGLGLRANRHWDFGDGRGVDFSARAQWQRSLAEHGEVFDASFVGLQQWQPLIGIGLSRYSGLFGVDMNATLSKHTTLKFSYDYEAGQHDNAQTLMTQLNVAF